MATNVVPTLSTSGWVSSVTEKADFLMAYFFEADSAQSSLYEGKTFSLPAIVQKFKGDGQSITQEIQKALNNYLFNYFETVSVTATYIEETKLIDGKETKTGGIDIKVHIKVFENGTEYNFGKILTTIDGKVNKVKSINN